MKPEPKIGRNIMDQIVAAGAERIDAHRKADLTVRVTDPAGRPVPGARVRIEQRRHDFRFGCILFESVEGSADKDNEARRFLDVFNYTTLPFYWGSYEPRQGEERRAELEAIARWCERHGVATKGHPLVWFEVNPEWAKSLEDPIRWNEERVKRIMRDFSGRPGAHGQYRPGLVECWDVINEATVADRHDNAFRAWFHRVGPTEMTRQALLWAREANPHATLLVNDYNLGPAYEELLGQVVPEGLCDGLGIQSHMQSGEWPLEKVWSACETYGRFGVPVHFTELSVVSGAYKPRDSDWYNSIPDWTSTPEGEARQAEYLESFFRLLFSHPAVEAVTYWGFRDPLWLNSPGGLLRADGSPKPSYEALRRLVREEWWTDASGATGGDGAFTSRIFAGEHDVTVTAAGRRTTATVAVPRRSAMEVSVCVS
jgi:GH35 family endo-1,4-beta-xylanase